VVRVSDTAGGASDEVDPDELRRQLTDIKGAMGLAEQYPGRARFWLVAGVLIGVAAVLVQGTFYFYETVGATGYVAIWCGFCVVAVATLWFVAARLPSREAPEGAPSWRVVYGSLAAFLLSATGVTGDVAGTVAGLDRALLYFGLVIATVGLGLLVTGAVLAAYRVRRRDRLVFYAGGAWVLVYASFIPYVELLRYVGVGLFGILFVVYAIGAYVYLTRA